MCHCWSKKKKSITHDCLNGLFILNLSFIMSHKFKNFTQKFNLILKL